ncbi:MAG: thiol protease/hemagglutinin PrtT, partial [Dysgonamonadaceae bacterium]|nr:thiol protease/hemagglutinin PrtT [Dysgonamonadaceae bacterium]
MKIRSLLFVAFFTLASLKVGAAPIDSVQAVTAAQHFFSATSDFRSGQLPEVKIVSVCTSAAEQIPYYYVLGNQQEKGWLILSGDDRILPVIAYSETGAFSRETNPTFDWWMEEKAKEIQAILSDFQTNTLRSTAVHQGWIALLSGAAYNPSTPNPLRSISNYTQGQDLLAGIKWNQWGSNSADNKDAGCVATAMGQVLKYWGNKKNLTQLQGRGSYEYIDHASNNALRRVDFSSKTYNLKDMPESTASDEIRDLLYDLGVSVRMAYASDGSGALNSMIPSALFSHFGFKPAEYMENSHYSDNWPRWEAKIVQEIEAERPVVYGGESAKGGHSFVLSGYKTGALTNEYFFNWGWSGVSDGWFVLRLSQPIIDYQLEQDAVFGIEPYENGDKYELTLSDLTLVSTDAICTKNNKFTNETSECILRFKITNNTNVTLTNRVISLRYFTNITNESVMVGSGPIVQQTIPGNYSKFEEIDISTNDFPIVDSWKATSTTLDLNCDLGVMLRNSDKLPYYIDIGRNAHVIRRVLSSDCSTGILNPEATADNLISYPNPVQDYIFIQTAGDISSDIAIYNTLGEKINPASIEMMANGETRIDVSRLSNGMYFISAGKQTGRFI